MSPRHVFFIQRGALPEQVKIVNKTNIVCYASGPEPGMKIRNPAKASRTRVKQGEWIRDEGGFSRSAEEIKKANKTCFC